MDLYDVNGGLPRRQPPRSPSGVEAIVMTLLGMLLLCMLCLFCGSL